jgi:steroid 5-alpha reductase family enzyme
MFSMNIDLLGLVSILSAAVCTWAVSLYKKNVAIVDSLWSLLFILTAFVYAAEAPRPLQPRAILVLVLTVVWGLRLSIHITWRNWGHGEEPRYRAIRARNQPHFALKSLYLVFALQALLAWLISLPLLGSILSDSTLGAVDAAGALLWLVGLIFEAGGDWQLARFTANPLNKGRVMDRGLWRYTRHPNYFGDFCVWWGFYLIALAAGAWWSIVGPLIMSLLLLRVSGVSLLESSIAQRRPGYADYVRSTSAFWPWFPKHK